MYPYYRSWRYRSLAVNRTICLGLSLRIPTLSDSCRLRWDVVGHPNPNMERIIKPRDLMVRDGPFLLGYRLELSPLATSGPHPWRGRLAVFESCLHNYRVGIRVFRPFPTSRDLFISRIVGGFHRRKKKGPTADVLRESPIISLGHITSLAYL